MKIQNDKAKEIIKDYVIAEFEKINVKAGKCRYNFRCSYNTVHDAIKNKQKEIAMCVYLDGDYPIIHFLNINSKNEYKDNTLGEWSTQYDYYLIKHIGSDDFFNVNSIFTKFRKTLRLKLPFWVRFFSDIEN